MSEDNNKQKTNKIRGIAKPPENEDFEHHHYPPSADNAHRVDT
jgi:hypothetical protein